MAALTSLTSLNLSWCKGLTDVAQVAALTQLTSLHLSGCTGLTGLPDLSALTQLTSLDLSGCKAESFKNRRLLPQLEKLYVFGTRFADLHTAICGDRSEENCLDAVHEYFAALGDDPKPDAEMKVFVLGNGRAGKTTLVRRLKDETYQDIVRSGEKSTHGVSVKPFPAPKEWALEHPVTLCFWDFGGQDIYHGTHALFVQEPAVYVLVYSHDTDNEEEVLDDSGFVHRNHRPWYWFDYLRQEAGSNGVVNSPVLYVQTKCDLPPGKDKKPRCEPGEGQFRQLSDLIHVDSTDDGLDLFKPRLKQAVKAFLKEHPQPPLPASWAAVRQAIRGMQAKKHPRTLTGEEFTGECRKHGCERNADVLLTALHRMGVVFHRPGVLGDRIVVDQEWVLEKVYSIFDRTKPKFVQEVRDSGGKFRRRDLQDHFWEDESRADQRLYLGFMEACGVCFRATASYDDKYEGFYIAPDLLPRWEDGPAKEFGGWSKKEPDARATVTYTLLHDGIGRGFLSRIGQKAGSRADYWRYGCRFWDSITGSEALVRMVGVTIRIEANGGEAAALVQTLVEVLKGLSTGAPLRIDTDERTPPPPAPPPPDGRDPVDRLDITPGPVTEEQLRRLGDGLTKKEMKQVRTFFLIGCGFQNGKTSMGEIATQISTWGPDNPLPWDPYTSGGELAGVVRDLRERFARVLDKTPVVLAERRGDKTTGAYQMTFDGLQAWEVTSEFLRRGPGGQPDWCLQPESWPKPKDPGTKPG